MYELHQKPAIQRNIVSETKLPVIEAQYEEFQEYDNSLLKALEQKNYSDALVHSQRALHFFVSEVMNLTNIYDFTYNENFLTNHEYVCYLQQPRIRRAIHAGNAAFNTGKTLFFYHNCLLEWTPSQRKESGY